MNLGRPANLANGAHVLINEQFRVQPGESVLFTADTSTDLAIIEPFMTAVSLAKAKPVVTFIPRLPFQGTLADPYIPEPAKAAALNADVWVDLTSPSYVGSTTFASVQANGRTRCILLGDLGAGLQRLYGAVDFDELFELQGELDALFAGFEGQTCRVTTPSGTDCSFQVAKPTTAKKRIVDAPGMQTPPGSVLILPVPESVRGRLVLDATFDAYYQRLLSPIDMNIDGRIRSIKGDGPDVRVLDRALRRAGGGEYGYVIHFTYGFHPAARFTGNSFVEDMRALGSNAIGLGIPWWLPGGGENHPDGLIKNQSIWIAGEQIVADGVLTTPSSIERRSNAMQVKPC